MRPSAKGIFRSRVQATVSILLILCLLTSVVPHSPLASLYGTAAASEITGARSNPGIQLNVACPSGIHVNTWNGNLFHSIPLLTIPGRGLPIEISMSYNSADHSFTPPRYGYGWQFSYNTYYGKDAGGNITIVWEDGRNDKFTKTDGSFTPPPGIYDTLEEYLSGKYKLTTTHGLEFYFDNPSHGRLTKIEDINGNTMTFSYTGDLLTTIIDAAGRQVNLGYTGSKLTTITDPNPSPSRSIQLQYDANDNLVSITDTEGNTTTYGYDSTHYLTSVTDPRGSATTITYHSSGAVYGVSTDLTSKSFLYNNVSRITTLTDSVGGEQWITRYTYNADGRISSVEDGLGNSVSMTWNADGNMIGYTDENGRTTDYTYDANGNILTATDAAGNTTTYTYESTYNKVTSITDANNHVTTFEYDAKGNLIKATDPLSKITTYAYDSYGQLTSTTDANSHTTTYNYNSYSDITSIADALSHTTSYTYDNVGDMLTMTDAIGNATSFAYDKLNRMTSLTNALSQQTAFNYDANGNPVRITDAESNSLTYTFDKLNRLSKVTDALGNQTNYGYDEMGNMKNITDANGHATTFAYDKANRLTSETDPSGNTTSYTYDAAGNLVSRTDANGDATTYTYDSLNRLTKIDYPGSNDVTYSYDAVGNLLSVSNSDASTSYTYDAANRLTGVTTKPGALTKTVSYTYNNIGNRLTMTDPDGGETTYSYDAANRLVSLTNPLGQTTSYTYDDANRLTRKDCHNEAYATYTYDAANRLLTLANKNSSGATISSYTYEYDSVGNRVKMTEADGNETTYAYDDLYRLTGVTYPDSTSAAYTYDAVGNRVKLVEDGSTTTTYTYDAADRLLTAGAAVTYDWDMNGNQITKTDASGTTSYAYDCENRLTSITFPDISTNSFSYYPDGRRLSKTAKSGTKINYFYDGFNALVDTDSGGTTVARYTSGLGIDDWVSMDGGGSSYYYLKDGLGSVTGLEDVGETVVGTYQYDAFGVIKSETGAVVNPYRFTGREYDAESGLYYYRTRYYDAGVGRFITKDLYRGAISQPKDLHRYTYVGNNPICWVDPLGLNSDKGFGSKVRTWGKAIWEAIDIACGSAIGGAGKALPDLAKIFIWQKKREKFIENPEAEIPGSGENGGGGGSDDGDQGSGGEPPADPVPELPTLILLAVGLLALGGYVLLERRKNV